MTKSPRLDSMPSGSSMGGEENERKKIMLKIPRIPNELARVTKGAKNSRELPAWLNETLLPGFGYNLTTHTKNLAIGETHVFSPSVISEFRLDFSASPAASRARTKALILRPRII